MPFPPGSVRGCTDGGGSLPRVQFRPFPALARCKHGNRSLNRGAEKRPSIAVGGPSIPAAMTLRMLQTPLSFSTPPASPIYATHANAPLGPAFREPPVCCIGIMDTMLRYGTIFQMQSRQKRTCQPQSEKPADGRISNGTQRQKICEGDQMDRQVRFGAMQLLPLLNLKDRRQACARRLRTDP